MARAARVRQELSISYNISMCICMHICIYTYTCICGRVKVCFIPGG